MAQLGREIPPFLLLQTCTKQGAMPAAVLAEAKRHGARLIELMPDNPGSYEIMSYVLMHDVEQSLEEARRLATTLFWQPHHTSAPQPRAHLKDLG